MENGNPNQDSSNQLEPDSLGEVLLKNSALTMSAKGISLDLKNIIKLKINYIQSIFKETNKLTETFLISKNDKVISESLSKNGVLTQLIDHILGEVFVTNITLNNILISFISEDKNINDEQKKMISGDIGRMIDREMEKIKKD